MVLLTLLVFYLAYMVGRYQRFADCVKEEPSENKREPPFTVQANFGFPSPTLLRSEKEILEAEWVEELQGYLISRPSKTLVMVTSSISYVEVLLNWLVALERNTQTDPADVLIISVDAELHRALKQRELSSVLVQSETMMKANLTFRNTAFTQIRVMRLALWRLLNHWGYSVLNIDIDAVPLRDLQPLFEAYREADMVAQQGYPGWRYKDFGATMCTGAVLYRSTPAMGQLNKIYLLVLICPVSSKQLGLQLTSLLCNLAKDTCCCEYVVF